MMNFDDSRNTTDGQDSRTDGRSRTSRKALRVVVKCWVGGTPRLTASNNRLSPSSVTPRFTVNESNEVMNGAACVFSVRTKEGTDRGNECRRIWDRDGLRNGIWYILRRQKRAKNRISERSQQNLRGIVTPVMVILWGVHQSNDGNGTARRTGPRTGGPARGKVNVKMHKNNGKDGSPTCAGASRPCPSHIGPSSSDRQKV